MSSPHILPVSTELLHDPKQLQANLRDQRAESGAQEFEAALFSSVLEKMEKSLSIEGEENDEPGRDTWTAMGVRAVAQCLAQRHVLGIAEMIEHSLGIKSESIRPNPGTEDGITTNSAGK